MTKVLFAFVLIKLMAPPPPATVAARAEEYLQARLKVSKFSGTVLVARDGVPVFARGYGFANYEHDVPNSTLTKFRLASVSKQFTAAGILLLEADGKLRVDDPVGKHLSEVPAKWKDVTLHQLMSHTSGVPENLTKALLKGMWPQPIDKGKLFDHIKESPLDFKPGEKWSYSNTGYALLGQIIEKITGKSYGDFLKARIFEPLGMHDTGVDHRRLVLKNRADNYGTFMGQTAHALYIDLSQVYSAGSMYSTVGDLLKWDNALYTDKILSKSARERMWTPIRNGYGYGWLIGRRFGRLRMAHTGGLPGCHTFVLRYPGSHVYVAVLCNLEGSPFDKVANELAAIMHGEPYDVPVVRVEANIDPKLFDPYVGEYELRPKHTVKVTKDGSSFGIRFPDRPKFVLLPESETKFFTKAAELTFAFEKDAQGKVTGLVVHDAGRDQRWRKVK